MSPKPRTGSGSKQMASSFWSPPDEELSPDFLGKLFCCSDPQAPHLITPVIKMDNDNSSVKGKLMPDIRVCEVPTPMPPDHAWPMPAPRGWALAGMSRAPSRAGAVVLVAATQSANLYHCSTNLPQAPLGWVSLILKEWTLWGPEQVLRLTVSNSHCIQQWRQARHFPFLSLNLSLINYQMGLKHSTCHFRWSWQWDGTMNIKCSHSTWSIFFKCSIHVSFMSHVIIYYKIFIWKVYV